MLYENFKKHDKIIDNDGHRVIPTIIDIAVDLKDELKRLEIISKNNKELRKDLWQDIKNLSKCINDLVNRDIVNLDDSKMEIISVNQIS